MADVIPEYEKIIFFGLESSENKQEQILRGELAKTCLIYMAGRYFIMVAMIDSKAAFQIQRWPYIIWIVATVIYDFGKSEMVLKKLKT